MNILFIWFGKVLGWLLRLSGRHGAALPGLIIEKLHPGFLHSMLKQLPEGVIIVSGTNGKTTTTKMIVELLASQGKRVLTNRTGGNFVRGVFSTIVQAAGPGGKLDYDIAVYEQDEAYAARFVELHQPRAVVLLNVTRDQLDRFGEIDTTAALLQKVAAQTTELVVLNDDDTRLNKLTAKPKTAYFGIAKELQPQFPNDEQLYGVARAELPRHSRAVELEAIKDKTATYMIGKRRVEANLRIDGQHNALNGAATLAALTVLYPKIKPAEFIKALEQIKPAFGRGEVIDYHGQPLILQLVKNPASFRQAMHVLDIHRPKAVGIVINDDHADGRDVSWLWDVEYQPLKDLPVITSGSRAYDMANRLKYDDIKVEQVESDLKKMVQVVAKKAGGQEPVIIFATYTAMLATRKAIGKSARLEPVG